MLRAELPESETEGANLLRAEHTQRSDSNAMFDSPELAEPTYAACEYLFVADPVGGLRALNLREWPGAYAYRSHRQPQPEGGRPPAERKAASAVAAHSFTRKARPWTQLEAAVRRVNAQLEQCGKPPLTLPERLAARLYTGPMALKYDALVKFATAPSADSRALCDELCLGNGYQATLTALNAALTKLAALSSATAPLYRCMGADAAHAAWSAATLSATCSAGLLTCVHERSAALAAAAAAVSHTAQLSSRGADGAMDAAALEMARSRSRYKSTHRDVFGGGGGSVRESVEAALAGGAIASGRPSPGGHDGAVLLRIDPCGRPLGANLNFLAQRPMPECTEAVLPPLTTLQLTSCHVEGAVLVLVAVGGHGGHAPPPSLLPHAHSLPLGAPRPAAPSAAARPSTPRPDERSTWPPAAAAAAAAAVIDGRGPSSSDHGAIDGIGDAALAAMLPGATPMGAAPERAVDGGVIEEVVDYAGCDWRCSWYQRDDGAAKGQCYFWFHLPHAKGGVQMRYRKVGDSRWSAHPQAVQLLLPGGLAGGWWRTPPWPHPGDLHYEQGCWVNGECVMAGILGPAEGAIMEELPPGTAPDAPYGLGADGVLIEAGRAYPPSGHGGGGRGYGHARAAHAADATADLASLFGAKGIGGRGGGDAGPPPPACASGGVHTPRGGAAASAATPTGAPLPTSVSRSSCRADPTLAQPAVAGAYSSAGLADASRNDRGPPPSTLGGGGHAIARRARFSDEAGGGEFDLAAAGERGVEFNQRGTGVVVGRGLQAESYEERRRRALDHVWHGDVASVQQQLQESIGLRVERMDWHGLRYVRIWSQHAASRGTGGGGFDLPPDAIEQLASAASSIHIRLRGDETESITLRPGVTWPLQQLARGLPFDRTLHGVDVTPSIAKVTWAGTPSRVDAMWNRGVAEHRHGDSLRHGRLYLACGNPSGLHLVAGERCEFCASAGPAPVEVWLGKVPFDTRIDR